MTGGSGDVDSEAMPSAVKGPYPYSALVIR